MGLQTKLNQTVRQIIYTLFVNPARSPLRGFGSLLTQDINSLIGLILISMLFVFSAPADADNSQPGFVVDVIDSVKHPASPDGPFYCNLSSLSRCSFNLQ